MSERAAAGDGGARGRLKRLALPAAFALMGCASVGAASVAVGSAGELARRFVAGPILVVAAALWLTGALRAHTLDLKTSRVLFFLGLLAAGVFLSLSNSFNLPAGVDTIHAYRGFPWYWLVLGPADGGGPTVSGLDGLGALGDIVFWAGVSLVVLAWMMTTADTRPDTG